MARNQRVILILNWHLRIGGVERKIADVARFISGRPEYADHEVHLLLDVIYFVLYIQSMLRLLHLRKANK